MVPQGARGILAASIILPILTIIAVSLRVVARKKKGASLQSDDWTIIINLIFVLGICSGAIYASCNGLHGVSFNLMTPETWVRYRKYQFAGFFPTHFVFGLIKISVTLFYKRVFITPCFQYWANATLVVVSLWMISAFFALLLCAHKVSGFWTTPPTLINTEYTLNLAGLILALNIIDIVLDAWILSMPMPVIKSLHMTTERKIAVAGVFLLGAFCFISSGIRLYYSRTLLTILANDSAKITQISDNNVMWAYIECGASTITACLPTLGPLSLGFRSPESLIRSVKSALSIKNSSLFSLVKKRQTSGSEVSVNSYETKRAWYEIHSRDTRLTVMRSAGSHDLEAQGQKPEGIIVDKSFKSAQTPKER